MTRIAEEGQERWEWNLPAGYTPDVIVPVCFTPLRCGV